MAWYRDWFGEDYLKVYPHRDEVEAKRQVDFVERLLPLKAGHRILDLGCGSGRHSAALAKRGYQVTCLDLSPVLLSLAKAKNTGEKCCTQFVRADMRAVPFSKAFDAVVSFFTTFGYFDTDTENLKTLRSIESALKSGGLFLLDYLNKSHVIDNLIDSDVREKGEVTVSQKRTYDRTKERIEKKIILIEGGETREYLESVRLYTLQEMRELLGQTRLKLEKTFGEFDGRPFSAESPRLILVGSLE
ncbi:class I SAM-dependent methyltransferase [bacterium]|nr:class I SAM-dependent methyltransferase [bacterium]